MKIAIVFALFSGVWSCCAAAGEKLFNEPIDAPRRIVTALDFGLYWSDLIGFDIEVTGCILANAMLGSVQCQIFTGDRLVGWVDVEFAPMDRERLKEIVTTCGPVFDKNDTAAVCKPRLRGMVMDRRGAPVFQNVRLVD